jgi:IS30 family transposase
MKLTAEDKNTIYELKGECVTQKQVAEIFEVSQSTISREMNRKGLRLTN